MCNFDGPCIFVSVELAQGLSGMVEGRGGGPGGGTHDKHYYVQVILNPGSKVSCIYCRVC